MDPTGAMVVSSTLSYSISRRGARKTSLSCCSEMSAAEERLHSTRMIIAARASDDPLAAADASNGFAEDVTASKLVLLFDPML